MAKDVANIIWEMAKNDRDYDGLKLKELYLKKMRNDCEDLRKTLSAIVEKNIKTKKQPHFSEVTLCVSGIENAISGGHASTKPSVATAYGVSDLVYKRFEAYGEVTNVDTIVLIREAILPLGLKWWCGSHNALQTSVTVSWAHWSPYNC